MKPDTGPVVQNLEGPFPSGPARVISLRRRGNAPLGFSVRGGWEHGTGVFVSDVQHASEAYRQGLRAGDQIIRVNGFSIQRAIHQEVLSLLKTKPGVVITVRRVGVIPVKEKGSDQLTWKIIDPGCSPTSSLLEGSNSISSGDSYHSDTPSETKIYIPDCETSGLGCSVVNGPPEFPGIFVSSIKPGGQADQAGLQIGDQIVLANGNSFLQVKFAEAISLLKSFKELHLMVKKQAGLQLFMDPLSINTTQNGIRNGYSSKSHEYSTQRPKTNGYCSSNGVHSTSGSSSTEQNGCLCESEKDFSLTEVEEEAQWTGSWKEGCSTPTSRKLGYGDDPRLVEEKRKLEVEQKRLDEERERLRNEKKKLQEERQAQTPSSEECRTPNFLSELQMIAEKMTAKGKRNTDDSKKQTVSNAKSPDDLAKRQQHEMLMEEIQVAHRKMFGPRKPLTTNTFNANTFPRELFEEATEMGTNVRKTVPRPPPKPNGIVKPFNMATLPQKETVPPKTKEGNGTAVKLYREECHETASRRHSADTTPSQSENKSVHFAGFSDAKAKSRDVHVKLFPTSNLQRQRHVKTRRKSDVSSLPCNVEVVINAKQTSQTVDELPKGEECHTYKFAKNGPLNLKLEGGIYSTMDGAVVVGELWEGGFVPLDGRITVGDHILKIDDVILENVSLTFASAALREAMNSSEENITIVVKKCQKIQPSLPS